MSVSATKIATTIGPQGVIGPHPTSQADLVPDIAPLGASFSGILGSESPTDDPDQNPEFERLEKTLRKLKGKKTTSFKSIIFLVLLSIPVHQPNTYVSGIKKWRNHINRRSSVLKPFQTDIEQLRHELMLACETAADLESLPLPFYWKVSNNPLLYPT